MLWFCSGGCNRIFFLVQKGWEWEREREQKKEEIITCGISDPHHLIRSDTVFICTTTDRWFYCCCWPACLWIMMEWRSRSRGEREAGMDSESSRFFACSLVTSSGAGLAGSWWSVQLIVRVPRLRCNSICHLDAFLGHLWNQNIASICQSVARCRLSSVIRSGAAAALSEVTKEAEKWIVLQQQHVVVLRWQMR